MDNINLTKKLYTYLFSLLIFLFWIFVYILKIKEVSSSYITYIENGFLLIIGLIVGLELVFIKDTFYEIVSLVYIPFFFAHPFDALTIPFFLFVALGIVIVGLIIHLIRFKFKYKKGKLLLGLSIFSLSCITGGLLVKDNNYLLMQLLLMSVIVVCFIFFYIFLLGYNQKVDFKIIVSVMNALAILLILQVVVFFANYKEGVLEAFQTKSVDVGWGCSNNVALFLLLTMPFAFYESISSNKLNRYTSIILLVIEYLTILATYSRGCIIIGTLGLIIMIIIQFVKMKKQLLKIIMTYFLTFAIVFAIIIYFNNEYPSAQLINNLCKYIFESINLETGNGRFEIYIDLLNKFKYQPILGYGMLYPFATTGGYYWGHCTYIHCLHTLGIVGVIAITYHMVEKYYGCLKNITLERLTLFLGFILSGLYGMIDISYFFINYMVVITMLFILADDYLKEVPWRNKCII